MSMKSHLWKIASAIFSSVILCSCSILPESQYHEIRSFDLRAPEKVDAIQNLTVEPFSSACSTKFKMLYRKGSNAVIIDEYNKWVLTPGQMITNYLKASFSAADKNMPDKSRPAVFVSGTVFCFETDIDSKTARLGINYELRDAEANLISSRSKFYSIPFKEFSPAESAEAMSDAAAMLASDIRADIAAIPSKK